MYYNDSGELDRNKNLSTIFLFILLGSSICVYHNYVYFTGYWWLQIIKINTGGSKWLQVIAILLVVWYLTY